MNLLLVTEMLMLMLMLESMLSLVEVMCVCIFETQGNRLRSCSADVS